MLTREDLKGIQNKIKATGVAGDKYLDKKYNTLLNSANSFLYTEEAIVSEVAIVQEVKAPQYTFDIESIVKDIINKPTDMKIQIPVKEIDDLEIPYFVTPFYSECKSIARKEHTTVDAIAFEKLAKQLKITVRRAVKLVNEGVIEVKI